MKKKLTFITGAGISQESGIQTFRDCENGLWNNYKIEDVATWQAWDKHPEVVQEFYNMRRKDILSKAPNSAHSTIAELEKYFDVNVITTNIDPYHSLAGSSKVLHLHGNITLAKSSDPLYAWAGFSATVKEEYYPIIGETLNYPNDKAPDGFPLRPHVVWFGETVVEMNNAAHIVQSSDILVVVGTSLCVQPAASLAYYYEGSSLYYIDPNADISKLPKETIIIKDKATVGMQTLINNYLINEKLS